MRTVKKSGRMIFAVVIAAMLSLSALAAPPGYVFDFSAEPYPESSSGDGDWNYVNDDGKRVLFTEILVGPPVSNGDFYMVFGADENVSIDADRYQWMKISLKNVSDCPKFEFHFAGGKEGISAGACTQFDISVNDTEYKTYIINIPQKNIEAYPIHDIDASEPTWWTGEVTQFRPDFMYVEESGGQAPEGSKMYVEYIAFFETEQDAVDYTFTPSNGPKETEAPTEAPETEAETTAEDTEGAVDAADAENAENEADADSGDESQEEEGATETPETTEPDGGGDEDSNMIFMIIIALGGVAVIIVIVVLMTKKK